MIDGIYYRFKFFDRYHAILNELIGPKIAKRLDLKSANNKPAIMKIDKGLNYYGIVSENFKDVNKEYFTMFELGFNNSVKPSYRNIKRLKKYCQEEDYYDLINNLFKMTCLDYLMGQVDRVASNFLFEKDNDKITFAPLFDYAEAYGSNKPSCSFDKIENKFHKFSVGNSFIAPSFWDAKFQRVIKKYPQFAEYLEKVCSLDIIAILKEIEEEHKLKISDDDKEYYYVRTRAKQRIWF